MRCTTLKAAADRLEGLLAYYAGMAGVRGGPSRPGPVDYYLDAGEPAGRWWGSGRDALGLVGEVEGPDMWALLDGRHPASGARLGRAFGDRSARGFDATFSAPKSVSVLWALTPDPWIRAEVLAAHDAAVEAALGWFETHGAVTRRGTDGTHQVDTRGISAALFRHQTSRTVDPQLHTHAVIAAKVQDPTGKWLSLDARFLKGQQRTIGWIYDAALRAELTSRLGVAWVREEERPTDLAVVPEQLRTLFSERSAQVEAKLAELIGRWSAEHDGEDPDPRTIAELERRAVVASRPSKAQGTDGVALLAEWTERARAAGFDSSLLDRQHLDQARPGQLRPSDDAVIGEALRRVQDESAAWLRADIARHLSDLVPVGVGASAEEVVAELDRLAGLAIDRCVPLGPTRVGPTRRDGRPITEAVTDRLFTTAAVLDQETDLQRWALNSATAPNRSLEPQQAAIAAMTGHDALVVVVGPAGTGKTTTTAHAVATLRARHRPVVGLAPSGKAADVLAREAGCPTDTVAGFLARHRNGLSSYPTGTTVVLDEAGMIATDDLAQVVDLVRRHRWRLVTVGDPAQLPAVGRGGVFAHWCDTVPHVELDTPRRFREPWESQASLRLRSGDPEAAETYAEHRRLRTIHPALLASDVARVHRRHVEAGRTVAITTTTAETARAINLAIHDQVDRQPGLRAHLVDGTTAGVGDQIATRRNDPGLATDRGERVRNRHTWIVSAVGRDGSLTASDPERGEVTLPARYVAQHVELGWAVTGYGNQGDTVGVGIAVLEPGTTRSHAYVAMTRGRDSNLALIPDPTGVADPAETFVEMISRTPRHDSALSTRARLHGEAGIPEPPLKPSAPADPEIAAKVESIKRRLDALEQRSRNGPSLGL
jgi:conjugative relaxase-like TrwC/TraI family protein